MMMVAALQVLMAVSKVAAMTRKATSRSSNIDEAAIPAMMMMKMII